MRLTLGGVAVVAILSAFTVIHARDDSPVAAERAGECRDWVVARRSRREIASARRLVPRMKRAFAAPGLSIAIAADGKLVWSESCGFADRSRRRKVVRATQFRVGGVSKTLTAATVARLSEDGLLHVGASSG